MKLVWSNAPEWANYLAQDEDGIWTWYECEPIKRHIKGGYGSWDVGIRGTKFEFAQQGRANSDWENTLEYRWSS